MQGTLLLRLSTHPLLQLHQMCKSFPPAQLHLLWEQNAAASEKGTSRHRPAHVPGYREEKMSVCGHLMLQDTCTWLCNGWTLVTPKEVGGPLYHNQGPLKKLHMENKAEEKQGLGHVVKGYTFPTDVPKTASVQCRCCSSVLRHFDHCVSSGYPVLFQCSEKTVMPLTESNMANANTRQCLT